MTQNEVEKYKTDKSNCYYFFHRTVLAPQSTSKNTGSQNTWPYCQVSGVI